MNTTMAGSRRKAFTLLELLVVISIISILATLMFPVFKRMQEQGRRVACMNNLVQIHRSIVLYGMDHSDAFPSSLSSMAVYLEDPQMLKCRSDRFRTTGSGISNITSATGNKFCSYNLVIKSLDGSQVSSASPASMVIACDKNGDLNNVTATGFGRNHGGEGGHVLLNGGSVKWMTADEWPTNSLGGADLASVVGY